jgi:threonyl-tRNA synthetase
MTDEPPTQKRALLLMGCPEVPVQTGIGLYIAYLLNALGWDVKTAGNPSVLQLFRVSDPEKHYIRKVVDLDKCIGDIVEKHQEYELCIVFAHNDAGISYAATMHHILKSRLMVVIFGRNAETLAGQVDFPCEKIVEKAVHNPMELKKKINEAFGWHASTS